MPQLSKGWTTLVLVFLAACSSETTGELPAPTGGVGGAGSGGTMASGSGGSAGSAGSAAGSLNVGGTGGTAPGAGGMPSAGLGGGAGTDAAGAGAGSGGSAGIAGTGGLAGSSSGSGAAGASGSAGAPVTTDRSAEGTCARWNADRANMSEGAWTGSVNTCDPGDISAEGRDNALRLFNLYRWLADLPAVETSPDRNEMAQACALMQAANWRASGLSHEPPMSWDCYTDLGAQGSSTSNISGGPGVSSVNAYLTDTGNETTFGHRRIVLSNWLGPIGLGSTGPNGASCMQNIGGTGKAGKEWVAWPPPGAFPLQAYGGGRGGGLGSTGWSVQSERIQLAQATVSVTSGGSSVAVNVSALTGNYGSTNGIRMVPNGWNPAAGQSYSVTLSGISTEIAYTVDFVDCAP